MDQLKMDLDNSAMPLDQRLEDAGIDAQEFKTYAIPGVQERKYKRLLTVRQPVRKSTKSQPAPTRMGAQDTRRRTAAVEGTTKHT
jgi:hypothetical protein